MEILTGYKIPLKSDDQFLQDSKPLAQFLCSDSLSDMGSLTKVVGKLIWTILAVLDLDFQSLRVHMRQSVHCICKDTPFICTMVCSVLCHALPARQLSLSPGLQSRGQRYVLNIQIMIGSKAGVYTQVSLGSAADQSRHERVFVG